ncbi:MAG TPA: phage holin family protein [Egibacteraceae bacterium]|nr:phage holin family protein [Egibacteraceae bacterium]
MSAPYQETTEFESEYHRLNGERSLTELLSELSHEFTQLLRKEAELARVEIKHDLREAARAGGMGAAAGGAAFMAVLLASFALAWGLAEVLPAGWAFLIVGVLWASAAAALGFAARTRFQKLNPVPEQTIETLKEDARWVSQRKR